MLNNILFNESLHFYIKNNFMFTNIMCFKLTSYIWTNINIVSINYIEKYSVEYFLKKIIFNILSSNVIIIPIIIQAVVIFIF